MSALLLPTGACGGGDASNSVVPRNDADAPADAAAPAARNAAQPAAEAAAAPAIPDAPGLEGMSPSQRRAYDRGYRDCGAGRYDPDRYPEAYRIGCGAAHDRKAGGPPQG